MRWLPLLLIGCGRVGLDPLTDAGVRTGDTRVAVDAAAPVTCASGTCASSTDDYSEEQGKAGWFYGCWDITDDTDGT